MTIADHVKLAVRVGEGGHGEGDDAAGGQRQVGVDDGAVLGVLHSQGAIEAGPEQPQEHRACKPIALPASTASTPNARLLMMMMK